MTKEEFCKRLKDINLTQKEFSEMTNVHIQHSIIGDSMIYKFQNG